MDHGQPLFTCPVSRPSDPEAPGQLPAMEVLHRAGHRPRLSQGPLDPQPCLGGAAGRGGGPWLCAVCGEVGRGREACEGVLLLHPWGEAPAPTPGVQLLKGSVQAAPSHTSGSPLGSGAPKEPGQLPPSPRAGASRRGAQVLSPSSVEQPSPSGKRW